MARIRAYGNNRKNEKNIHNQYWNEVIKNLFVYVYNGNKGKNIQ